MVTSIHLASQLDEPDILFHLLARGGNVEIRDANKLSPLDVARSYEIRLVSFSGTTDSFFICLLYYQFHFDSRKMLLNSVMLCAASEAGDLEEVMRLLTHCGVPLNVCGLRNKAPLHLACSQGHAAIVNLLLTNGVSCFFTPAIAY